MDWDGDDGLRKMWDRYYMCPNPAYIQFLQATRDATIGLTPANTSCQDTHVFLDKVPNGGLVQGDKDAAVIGLLMYPTLRISRCCPPSTGAMLTFRWHLNIILCLLRTKSPANQGVIPQKLLTKSRSVNMGTMVGINDSFARAGGKALTVMKLQELGSKAKCNAWRLYDAGEDCGIPLGRADAMIPDGQPPAKICPSVEEFWWSLLPNGFHINSMDPDGNCLFRSLSDTWLHPPPDHHHICRHSNKFKDFLLLQDTHEDISDLDIYIHKMGQNS